MEGDGGIGGSGGVGGEAVDSNLFKDDRLSTCSSVPRVLLSINPERSRTEGLTAARLRNSVGFVGTWGGRGPYAVRRSTCFHGWRAAFVLSRLLTI